MLAFVALFDKNTLKDKIPEALSLQIQSENFILLIISGSYVSRHRKKAGHHRSGNRTRYSLASRTVPEGTNLVIVSKGLGHRGINPLAQMRSLYSFAQKRRV